MVQQQQKVRSRRHPVDAFHTNNDDNRSATSSAAAVAPAVILATPYTGIIQKHINNDGYDSEDCTVTFDKPVFDLSSIIGVDKYSLLRRATTQQQVTEDANHKTAENRNSTVGDNNYVFSSLRKSSMHRHVKSTQGVSQFLLILMLTIASKLTYKSFVHNNVIRLLHFSSASKKYSPGSSNSKGSTSSDLFYPDFVFEHPYVTSSYYSSTSNTAILEKMDQIQVEPKKDRPPDRERGIISRLAILRPFCEFDADALPTTFACWNSLVPCRAAEQDLGGSKDEEDEIMDEWVLFDMSTNGTGRKLSDDEQDYWECEADYGSNSNSTSFFRGIANSFFKRCKRKPPRKDYFDDVPADGLRTTSADLFLFYSQTFSENDVAMVAVDKIMEEFFSPGGWSRCFDNIYAVEANIPKELDLYIPAAQEELYNWVNGPNRQYEAGFRIIQSGEWGDYDGFYLMEGDSVPVKNYWLDVILGEINAYRPFAVLGA